MARYTGRNLVVRFISTSGTADFSSDYRVLNTPETADEIDASAGGDTRKVFLPGPIGQTWDLEFLPQAGGTALWALISPQTEGTLEWSPEGTASTKQKHTAAANILGRALGTSYNGVTTIKLNGRITAAPTDAAW